MPGRDGWILIDTGMPSEPCWQALLDAAASAGVDLRRLRHIVLTHMHPDHCGLAPRLREATGAAIWLHEEDARLLRIWKSNDQLRSRLHQALLGAGTPPPLREAVLAAHDEVVRLIPFFEPDRLLDGGAAFELDSGSLRVLHTPGHSPGHCCLFAPDRGLLFSSDHVLENITPHVGWLPGEDSLGRYFDSLEQVSALEAALILPAHGLPFTGLAGAAAAIRSAHLGRLGAIQALPPDVTVDQIIRAIWPRQLHPLNYQLALTQVLAYREHLSRSAGSSA